MIRYRGVGLAGGVLLLLVVAALGLRWPRSAGPLLAIDDIPAPAADSARDALAVAGYAPVGPPAWAAPSPRWGGPGRYRVFFAAASPAGGADVYVAAVRVAGDGRSVAVVDVRRLSDTPAGDETAPLAAGRWLAYATQVGGRYQSVTAVLLADTARAAVFAFDQPAAQAALAWAATAGENPQLTITADWPDRPPATFAIRPEASRVEPKDAGLTYTPLAAGEQAWLPNLVSRVRELPGVGPEKIAFLENVFFTVVDRGTLWLHGLAPATPPTTAVSVGSDLPPAVPSVTVTEPASATEALATVAAASTGAPPASEDVTPAGVTPAVASTLLPESPPVPPATLAPTVTATPAGVRLADGVVRRAALRPDPQRPYAEAEVIELDPSLVQIKMIPGTIEPKPTTGLVGSGVIPQEDWPGLVAGFNGGFAAMHGMFGMMVDRKVYLPARNGVATLAVYEDGSLRMGTWGVDLVQTADMVSYRQNCPPLIENGVITAETGKLTLWGLSISNEVYLYRSGLGLTADGRLVYVAGKPLSAYTLTRALQAAGAVYAMQLDVDEYHVAFITYDVRPGKAGQPPQVEGKKLRADMRGFDGLFLWPFQLDFFYLVARAERLAQPVRSSAAIVATPSTAPGPAVTPESLPGQLAFASNRAGNWEIYTQRPGQPATAVRRTDHGADDLYPAWSPDGSRLAFTSRRDGNAEVYVLTLADGRLERITRQPSEEWAPAWSPDGRLLAYQTDRHGRSDIYVSAADGGNEVRLTSVEGNHEAPHWSPDGRQIVFDSDLDVGEAVHASINLYFMNADGSNPRRFVSYAESPAWSPDGKTIAFAARRGGHWQVITINTDGTAYRQVTTGAYDARYAAWSPDGRWLAFAGNETGHWELYGVAVAGGKPLRLTFGATDNSYPAWSR